MFSLKTSSYRLYYYILQEDLLTFVDVRTLKIKHEEQFKYEVKDRLLFMITSQLGIEGHGKLLYCRRQGFFQLFAQAGAKWDCMDYWGASMYWCAKHVAN